MLFLLNLYLSRNFGSFVRQSVNHTLSHNSCNSSSLDRNKLSKQKLTTVVVFLQMFFDKYIENFHAVYAWNFICSFMIYKIVYRIWSSLHILLHSRQYKHWFIKVKAMIMKHLSLVYKRGCVQSTTLLNGPKSLQSRIYKMIEFMSKSQVHFKTRYIN